MKVKVITNVGRRRASNQDYAEQFKSDHGQYLLVLCDGVGGHQAGDVASKKTTEFIGKAFLEHEEPFTLESFQKWMNEIIEEVNQYIYDLSQEEICLQGMGTTLVVASVIESHIVIAHVGDSRAYVYQPKKLIRLTEDHSLVNALIQIGEITREESLTHPQRHAVIQSIGVTDTVEAEISIKEIGETEILMLCSDGLTNMVSEEELLALFESGRHEEGFAEHLVEAANDAGGRDNITLILASQLNEEVTE